MNKGQKRGAFQFIVYCYTPCIPKGNQLAKSFPISMESVRN